MNSCNMRTTSGKCTHPRSHSEHGDTCTLHIYPVYSPPPLPCAMHLNFPGGVHIHPACYSVHVSARRRQHYPSVFSLLLGEELSTFPGAHKWAVAEKTRGCVLFISNKVTESTRLCTWSVLNAVSHCPLPLPPSSQQRAGSHADHRGCLGLQAQNLS